MIRENPSRSSGDEYHFPAIVARRVVAVFLHLNGFICIAKKCSLKRLEFFLGEARGSAAAGRLSGNPLGDDNMISQLINNTFSSIRNQELSWREGGSREFVRRHVL